MKLIHTALGELYQSFSAQELKELDLYLKRQVLNKGNTLIQLHKLYREAKQSKQLDKLDTQYIKNELFENSDKGTTKQTTYTNFLLQHIKEFLLLSKIKEKNIYAEVLWGELLIERGLKKNLLVKNKNYVLDFLKDGYAFLKDFYYKRELFYFEHLTLNRKNYDLMIKRLEYQIDSFDKYTYFFKLELYYSLITFYKQRNKNIAKISQSVASLIQQNRDKENVLINLQILMIEATIAKDDSSYFQLRSFMENNIDKVSSEIYLRIIPILVNYCIQKIAKGFEDYDFENYQIFKLLEARKLLFTFGIFSIFRIFFYIRSELRYGNIEKAAQILEDSLKFIPVTQKESFQYLIESRIDFAKKNYRDALHKISIVDPKDSIYYYPQYKIMSIMCQVMMGDYDRLNMERDNFYKFIYNHKEVPEDAKRRHKLFIRYTEYLIEARFEHLSDYMHRRIENALLPTSPYFTEKEWVRERWNELKAKFD